MAVPFHVFDSSCRLTADVDGLLDDGLIDSHCRRKEAGDAVFHNAGCNFTDPVGIAVADILAEIAVDMNVDESGRNICAGGVHNLGACGNIVVIDESDDASVISKRFAGQNPVLENKPAVFDKLHNLYPYLFTFIMKIPFFVHGDVQAAGKSDAAPCNPMSVKRKSFCALHLQGKGQTPAKAEIPPDRCTKHIGCFVFLTLSFIITEIASNARFIFNHR